MTTPGVTSGMPTLCERLQREPGDPTLAWYRHAEIEADAPVPFCCPRAAGIRVVSPGFLREEEPPVWLSMAQSWRFSTSQRYVVTNCPFCGVPLPRLVLRKDPPSPLRLPDEDCCGTCGRRGTGCNCYPPASLWEAEGAPPVFAAVVLATRTVQVPKMVPSVRFLSVSRKGRPSEKGLPGGRIEPGETAEAAARRELLEETGFLAGPMHKVFDAVDDAKVRVVAFRAETVSETPTSLQSSETGVVEWVSMSDLVASSPFASFNESLFALLEIRC